MSPFKIQWITNKLVFIVDLKQINWKRVGKYKSEIVLGTRSNNIQERYNSVFDFEIKSSQKNDELGASQDGTSSKGRETSAALFQVEFD